MDPSTPRRSIRRATLGTTVFALVVVVPLVALAPWVLDGWHLQPPLFDGEASRWFGGLLVVLGLPVWGEAAVRFVRHGRGTPAPFAPPQRLIVTGLYRYVRNPMYIAVVAMIFGQAVILGSRAILLFAIFLAIGFHWFVMLYEEPVLRRRYGEQYLAYRRQVPRWIPRTTPADVETLTANPTPDVGSGDLR
jgi:protein-S-isoprenylcysteine O-methyltransferase Ste14